MMKKDIQNRADIQKLMTTFYEQLLQREEMKHIFLEVARIDVLEHLDILVDFWESVLFQAGTYKRNAMEIHLDLHRQYPLTEAHFKTWLHLFNETTDTLFEGAKATMAKERALSIASIIKMKIDHLDRLRQELNN